MKYTDLTTLLLIEDNPAEAVLFRENIEAEASNFVVLWAQSTMSATEIIYSRDVDVIITDLNLEESSGFKTVQTLFERVPNIPVIIYSGLNNEIISAQAMRLGVQDYIIKGSFTTKQLIRTIQNTIIRSRTFLEYKSQNQELQNQLKKYSNVLESSQIGYWELTLPEDSMYWSHGLYEIFQLPRQNSSRNWEHFLSMVYPPDRAKVEEYLEECTRTTQSTLKPCQHRIQVAGNKIKYMSLFSFVHHDYVSSKISIIGILQEKISSEEKTEFQQEMEIQSRMNKIRNAILDDIIFNTRTPLSSMINLVYAFENGKILPNQKELINELKVSTNDMSSSINQLINYSFLSNTELQTKEEDFSPIEFLARLKSVLQLKSSTSHVHMDLKFDPQMPPMVTADQNLILQIFYNIYDFLVNSVRSKTNIAIRIKPFHNEKMPFGIEINIKDQSLNLELQEVQDWALEKNLIQLFEKSPHSENKARISLIINERIVHALKGSLKMEKLVTGAFNFCITIPLKVSHNKPATLNETPSSQLRILVAEDNPVQQTTIKRMLTTWTPRITVDVADNGLVAVEKSREFSYDLILMDMQMPVMNGLEASKKIREKSDIPIIMMSAQTSSAEEKKCAASGINDYMKKPFQPEELFAHIMKLFVVVE